jgi:hypothetical protein
MALLLIAAASCLHAESKIEIGLRAEMAGQAKQLAAQASTIADLRAQLSAAHIQTATANGAVSGSGEAIIDLKSQLSDAHRETATANSAASSAASGSAEKVTDLQSQLAEAHVQTATAKGAASGSRNALASRRLADNAATAKSCQNSSLAAAEQISAQLFELSREQKRRSSFHSETMEKIDHQNVMSMRLMVLMCVVLLIKFLFIAYLLWRKLS